MTQRNSKKESKSSRKVGIGVGLTAAAVAAAGAFFLYGSKNAVQNRKTVKSWMLKARGEVLEALEKAENMTEDDYKAIVEAVGGAYSTTRNATTGEIKDFKKEMKQHWEKIQKSGVAKKVVDMARGTAKSAKRPAVKKATKATPKKTKKA